LKEFDLDNVLIVTDSVDQNLFLSARNLSRVSVVDVSAMDPVSLVGHDNVLMTVNAVKQVEEMLA
jgi:large subunit ribosomal protein L4